MRSLYLRAIYKTVVGAVALFAAIFLPAWTVDYWQGWAFFLTLMVSMTLVTIYMARHDKALLESRLRTGPTVEKTGTQRLITSINQVLVPGVFLIMPLDHRLAGRPLSHILILGDVSARSGC